MAGLCDIYCIFKKNNGIVIGISDALAALVFCYDSGIDVETAVRDKLRKNATRYPVAECYGSNVKR